MKTRLVFAGSAQQFHNWCRQNDGNPTNAIYVGNAEVLLGRTADDYEWVMYGTPADRGDFELVMRTARSRGFVSRPDPDVDNA